MFVFLSFLAFVVVRYIQLGARRDILGTLRFEFLVGIVVIILVSMEFAKRKPNIGGAQDVIIMIGLLFGAMIVQLPLAAAPVLARTIFNDRVIKFAFLTYFMAVMIESPNQLRWFLAIFLFSVFYITLEAFQGLLSGGLVWQSQGIMRLHGAVPIYMHPNSLSGVAMGSLPYVVFLFRHVKYWYLKLALLGGTGTALVCIVYSGSRTGYLGLIAFVLWWWFQSEKKVRFFLLALVLGVAVVNILPQQYIERFESITGEEKEGASKASRILILKDAWTVFLENPAGVGVASFPAVRMKRFGRFQDTHNLYMEVATNLGIQGLIIFIGLVVVVLKQHRKAFFSFRKQKRQLDVVLAGRSVPRPALKATKSHYEDLVFLADTAKAAGGFVVIRLVLGAFGMDLYEVYWWFASGLALVYSSLMVSTQRKTNALIGVLQSMEEGE